MSPDLERLIGRAITDKAFRGRLMADPEGTVKGSGLSLTPDEIQQVKDAVERAKTDPSFQQLDQQYGVAGTW